MSHGVESLIGRWSEGPGPLHRKLSDALRNAVLSGRLPRGERLPSERQLAVRLAVSRSTVVTAYDTLRSEGLLESRQGSGTRVGRRATGEQPPALPVSPIYKALLEDTGNVISLAYAVLPAHPLVAEAVTAVLAEDADKLLSHHGYVPAGLPALREAVAAFLTAGGTPTTPDQVLVTTGAQQAVTLATALTVRPGDDVVVEEPTFSGTIDVFRTRGARLVPVPVDDQGVDPRAVAHAVAERRPAALYLMPSFHNPTGALLPDHRRRALAELVATTRVPLIEDNALESTPLVDEPVPPVAAFAPADAPVLTTGSMSKAVWGGLRVGWLRGPAPMIARAAEAKSMHDLGSPLIDQAIASRLVPQLDRVRADRTRMLRRNLATVTDMLNEALPSWEWQAPSGGPSLWVRLPAGTAAAFAQVALRHGVEVIPGEVMSVVGGQRDRIRFPYMAEPPVLEETVRRLAQAWESYAPAESPHPSQQVVV